MFIAFEAFLDNYAGRSEVALLLPALTFGVAGTTKSTPRLTARLNPK